jgi:thymidylate synthase
MHATEAWLRQIKKIVDDGHQARDTLELLSSSLSFDMNHPVMVLESRKVNYGFMYAEAAYILAGRTNVNFLTPHIKRFKDYSDLFPLQQGSYGPPFVEQVRYVVDSLMDDESTRQAVMTIWRPNPRKSKDTPCTISLQFLIRDGKLHTIATMRSSDAWTGLIYDMFCFTAMTAAVKAFTYNEDLELGTCWINAGSSHLYEKDMTKVYQLTETVYDEYGFVWPDDYNEIVAHLDDLAREFADAHIV